MSRPDSGFGERLRLARVRAGLSQRQLAFPGCTPGYISRLESGDRRPSQRLLAELARRLSIPELYLTAGADADHGGTPNVSEPLTQAQIALRLGDLAGAEHIYESAAKSDSDAELRAAALAGLGQVAFRRGDHRRAIELLEEARQISLRTSADPEVAEALGRAYALVGDFESATALFTESLRTASERGDLVERVRFTVLLSNTLIDASDFDGATALIASILTEVANVRDPMTRARVWWSQSRLHLAKENFETAARYARKTLHVLEEAEFSGHAARAHQLLAHIELDRGRPGEALELLERSEPLVADSGNRFEYGVFRLERARALAHLGRTEEAAATAMEASTMLGDSSPLDSGRAHALVAQVYDELGDTERAVELYELAAETLVPGTRYALEVHVRLADLLERQGRQGDALEALKTAVRAHAEALTQPPLRPTGPAEAPPAAVGDA